MRIGIIGAGLIGRALARVGVAHGHEVMLSNARGPDTLGDVAAATGCKVGTVAAAASFGDIIVVAIPLGQYRSIPSAALAAKVVVDANNYYPDRDGQIAALDKRQTTTSELLARHLVGAKLVKAFNAILAADLEKDGRPVGSADRRALPIAGDDEAAKKIAADLIDQFGFDAVDVGGLSESWRFERAKPAYCVPFDSAGLRRALKAAKRDVEVPEGSWRVSHVHILLAALAFGLAGAASPALAQAPQASQAITPLKAAVPRLDFMMRFYAPLQLPMPIHENLIIFQAREGGYIAGPRISGVVVPPTGDWIRILPNGNMRIDVRAAVKLPDGAMAYVSYGGVLTKPSGESWKRFMAGEKIVAPEWRYVVTPTFETGSATYGWLNDIQAVGKFISVQTGPDAHVAFDIYEVR